MGLENLHDFGLWPEGGRFNSCPPARRISHEQPPQRAAICILPDGSKNRSTNGRFPRAIPGVTLPPTTLARSWPDMPSPSAFPLLQDKSRDHLQPATRPLQPTNLQSPRSPLSPSAGQRAAFSASILRQALERGHANWFRAAFEQTARYAKQSRVDLVGQIAPNNGVPAGVSSVLLVYV
jgi:hypothetical protein